MKPALSVVLLSLALALTGLLPSAQAEPYRTDASEDEALPWYLPQMGEFPPADAAHYFAGEFIGVDHLERSGVVRTDRTDGQRRSHWDLPVYFQMLPYGSIYLYGAPAEIRDIPLGTHLHGQWFMKDPEEPLSPAHNYSRKSLEIDFTRCFQLEDDFSYYQRQGKAWRVEEVNLAESKISVLSIQGDEAGKDITLFDLTPATRIWKGQGFGKKEDIAKGQTVQLNLTWATLYGPGRITDIWLDEESRQLATEKQLAIHRLHQKDHGLAGWIDAVDNQERILTITFFGGIDPKLLEDFKENSTATVCVAEPNLRTYDQVNDRKRGPILSVKQIEQEPGSSGLQIQVQPDLLLEGYRPNKIVRVFASGWEVQSIPFEERLWPRRD